MLRKEHRLYTTTCSSPQRAERSTARQLWTPGALYLELTLSRGGALPKDVQDEGRAVPKPHAILEKALQRALLSGRQLIVENHCLGAHLWSTIHRCGAPTVTVAAPLSTW